MNCLQRPDRDAQLASRPQDLCELFLGSKGGARFARRVADRRKHRIQGRLQPALFPIPFADGDPESLFDIEGEIVNVGGLIAELRSALLTQRSVQKTEPDRRKLVGAVGTAKEELRSASQNSRGRSDLPDVPMQCRQALSTTSRKWERL